MSGKRTFAILCLAGWLITSCAEARPGPHLSPNDEPTPDGATLDAALIRCDADGGRVLTPRVNAQGDGVHLRVENDSDVQIVFSWVGVRGDGVEPRGERTFVWPLPPGDQRVGCQASSLNMGTLQGHPLEVLDPGGYWISDMLDCKEAVYGGGSDARPSASDDDRELEAQTRAAVPDIRADDTVERAAYPRSTEEAEVRVVREGRVVAIASFFHEDGGWSFSDYSACV